MEDDYPPKIYPQIYKIWAVASLLLKNLRHFFVMYSKMYMPVKLGIHWPLCNPLVWYLVPGVPTHTLTHNTPSNGLVSLLVGLLGYQDLLILSRYLVLVSYQVGHTSLVPDTRYHSPCLIMRFYDCLVADLVGLTLYIPVLWVGEMDLRQTPRASGLWPVSCMCTSPLTVPAHIEPD